ncbi:roadblock/LC7 domain-containing protein [Anaerosoma tenue]|uniref:roadblock/LC7 domain-containing protein n=1 Tax=Anaerosoma tenue TaxID=2933588 RepID=UPI002B26689F|nr:roadblock/LC7 domain-containing protein [Anaerosoma tenue]
MVDKGIGDYFISDTDDESYDDDDLLGAPVVVPVTPQPAQTVPAQAPAPAAQPARQAAPVAPAAAPAPQPAEPQAARPQATTRQMSREEQLAQALDELMREDGDIQAAALVSLDGFTMASALPAGMQADRVGAMSAAILGLGERAAAELGRGHLSQVFIEGENGYVLLIAAGSRAVLTAMADPSAKLGLVLYDMKAIAERIGNVLG